MNKFYYKGKVGVDIRQLETCPSFTVKESNGEVIEKYSTLKFVDGREKQIPFEEGLEIKKFWDTFQFFIHKEEDKENGIIEKYIVPVPTEIANDINLLQRAISDYVKEIKAEREALFNKFFGNAT